MKIGRVSLKLRDLLMKYYKRRRRRDTVPKTSRKPVSVAPAARLRRAIRRSLRAAISARIVQPLVRPAKKLHPRKRMDRRGTTDKKPRRPGYGSPLLEPPTRVSVRSKGTRRKGWRGGCQPRPDAAEAGRKKPGTGAAERRFVLWCDRGKRRK